MKTKGALVWGTNEPWSIEEIEIGDPRQGGVRVRMETAVPILGGHEGAGGTCRACQTGLRNLCDLGMGLLSGASVADGSFRIQSRGHDGDQKDVIAMSLLGTFAPYVVAHHTSVVKVDPTIPFDVACLAGCGVTTGYGSAVRSADVRPGQDVAVIGIGGVGVAALQGALIAGARRVFAIDPVEWKRRAGRHVRRPSTTSPSC